jgi:hypothetical protein
VVDSPVAMAVSMTAERAADAPAVCFCTLAVHAPYRHRARLLCGDVPSAPWVVLTDEPNDFADLPVRAIRHLPTGPMALDYQQHLAPTGDGRGAAAYHDKRFALQVALQDFDTALFLDADSRLSGRPPTIRFSPGLAVVPVVRKSIADHLTTCGSWRQPAFAALARELLGDVHALHTAAWCHETCYAVTRDGQEKRFFAAWSYAADYLQRQGVYSGEGGVMGLAAKCAGWSIDYDTLAPLASLVEHEGGGPKR